MKELILNNIKDLVSDFVYYDRKEDEELNAEQLREAIGNGTISIDEIVAQFRETLQLKLSNLN